jgi:hypothetical protein
MATSATATPKKKGRMMFPLKAAFRQMSMEIL